MGPDEGMCNLWTYIDAIGVPRGVPNEYKLADQIGPLWPARGDRSFSMYADKGERGGVGGYLENGATRKFVAA